MYSILTLSHPVIYLSFELRILTRNEEKSGTDLCLVPCSYLFIRALDFDPEQGHAAVPVPLFREIYYLFAGPLAVATHAFAGPCRCSCSAVPRDLSFMHGATGSGHACLGGSMPLFLFRRSAGFIIYSRAAGGSGTNMSKSIYSLVPVPTLIYYPFIFKSGTGTR